MRPVLQLKQSSTAQTPLAFTGTRRGPTNPAICLEQAMSAAGAQHQRRGRSGLHAS
jgi:hypothetical protein